MDASLERSVLRKEYLRSLVADFPVMTIKQLLSLAAATSSRRRSKPS